MSKLLIEMQFVFDVAGSPNWASHTTVEYAFNCSHMCVFVVVAQILPGRAWGKVQDVFSVLDTDNNNVAIKYSNKAVTDV